jgi:DNA-binding transcriptional MerR regulator
MKNPKLYYSISEVSELTSLEQYVLRYWETEFTQLKPKKNRAGNRIYKESDISIINEIKHLLYNDKYTIAGARQYLKSNKGIDSAPDPQSDQNNNAVPNLILKDVLKGIDDLLSELKDAKKL